MIDFRNIFAGGLKPRALRSQAVPAPRCKVLGVLAKQPIAKQNMHAHIHAGHTHSNSSDGEKKSRPEKRLAIVFVITASFMVVEAIGGVVSGSLALLADAGHMLTDALAIGMSWFAIWLAKRKTSLQRTYGFKRAEILAAFLNALVLVFLAGWIVFEASERMMAPRPVMGGVMLLVALAGLVINIAGLVLLRGHSAGNITVRAALWHILGDLLGSVGAIGAAIGIYFTGWMILDPLISIGIALLIFVGSGRMLLDTTNLLLDSVPDGVDSVAIRDFLVAQREVLEICDLHIWAVSATDNMLTAHLVIQPDVERDGFQRRILQDLRDKFSLTHMTLQLEGTPQETCDNGW